MTPHQDGASGTKGAESVSGSFASLPFLWSWGLLLILSFYRAPIPGINEPHYLTKAKHLWDSGFCPGDFFLDSSNPHLIFYVAIGWLTTFCSLTTTAIVGRIVALGLLAWGWDLASRHWLRNGACRVVAVLLFVFAANLGTLAGEWIIGGIESKVFAYGLLLGSAGLWRMGNLLRAATLAGLAVSFHPVVAGWWLIALLIGQALKWSLDAGLRRWWQRPRQPVDGALKQETIGHKVPLRTYGVVGLVGLLTALPGLLPALMILGGDPALSKEANLIQLKWRLGHHIDPLLFPARMWQFYGVMLGAWLMLLAASAIWRRSANGNSVAEDNSGGMESASLAGLCWFTLGALVIAASGAAVGFSEQWLPTDFAEKLRLALLKFYFFRLADVALPAALSVTAVWWLDRWLTRFDSNSRRHTCLGVCLLIAAIAVGVTTERDMSDGLGFQPDPAFAQAELDRLAAEKRQQWIEVCDWIRTSTPPDAVVVATSLDTSWAVKWFAERTEFFSFKDCPQEPAGIVEWWQRRHLIAKWRQEAKKDGTVTIAELQELHALTGIDYLLVTRFGPVEAPAAYEHGPFKVIPIP
ncbi:MAG: DUF6798 domain-containing protein [Planctomycetaceae bacterium]